MNKAQQEIKQNLVDNCLTLTQLFGLGCDLQLFVKEHIAVYGLINTGKTFWSKEPHKTFSSICIHKKTITIGFISDLTRELVSLVSDRIEIRVKPYAYISPNKSNSKTLLQQQINHDRKNHGLNPINFNDKDYY